MGLICILTTTQTKAPTPHRQSAGESAAPEILLLGSRETQGQKAKEKWEKKKRINQQTKHEPTHTPGR